MSAGAETNFQMQEAAPAGRQEAAMLGAAGRLLAAYASLPGVMYGLKDGSDGRYLAASESLAQFYGRPLDDVLGHNDTELLDPTLGAAMRAADQTALAHGRQLSSEHRFDWRDNKHDWEVLLSLAERVERARGGFEAVKGRARGAFGRAMGAGRGLFRRKRGQD